MSSNYYKMGIDIGSTTAKVVILDQQKEIIYSAYHRHNAQTVDTLLTILQEAVEQLGNAAVKISITGSAGMGLSEKFELPFVQEVIASAEVVHQLYPQVNTLIDIGGEDAKMIFFDREGSPDIRMNGPRGENFFAGGQLFAAVGFERVSLGNHGFSLCDSHRPSLQM